MINVGVRMFIMISWNMLPDAPLQYWNKDPIGLTNRFEEKLSVEIFNFIYRGMFGNETIVTINLVRIIDFCFKR